MSITSVDLSTYVRVGRYDLPEPTRTTPPDGTSLLDQEASAVTYDWDTDTLFVAGDGGTSIVQVSTTGALINSMTLAPGGSPQGTTFYDTEGLTYIGSGQFVMTEERDRQVVQFTYAAGSTLQRADTETVKLGTTIGNIGLEGVTYDPQTGGFILVKEKTPESIFQTNIDFANHTATNGSPSTDESTNLFDPALVGTSDFSDVYALSNLPSLDGQTDSGHLLIISQESGRVVEVDRSGNIDSTLLIWSDPGNPLSVTDQTNEGVTMDRDGNLYIVNENGGGDANHPQLWVYAPSAAADQAPTAVTLTNQVNALPDSTNTTARIKVATVTITDDGLGPINFSVSGADAAAFEVDNTGLYIKAGTVLDFQTKPDYAVTVNVDDPTVGATPDASTTFDLNLTNGNQGGGHPSLFISEVAPWSSGNSPLGADWFEVTNTGSSAVDITGWKMNDDSDTFGSAVALTGIASIGAGESVIFIETSDLAAAQTAFINLWFGGNAPAGLQIGSYSGSGVGLSTGGDHVNLFDSSGVPQASVAFGASQTSSPFDTFDNSAGVNGIATPLTQISAVGVHGAQAAAQDANEIGSPGTAGKLFISEVAPWSSGDSPVGADWFEVTNSTAFDVDVTGWKMDDGSQSFAAAVALAGITTIHAGESVIFIETSTPDTTAASFISTWFGANAPAGLQIGSYSGSGVGLSTSSDQVNLYDASGVLKASVAFGASPGAAPFATFDNAAGIDGVATPLTGLSAAGTDGAAAAAGDANEIGSPGGVMNPVDHAPTALTLSNEVNSIVENTSTAARIKVADVTVTDDGLGPNNLSVSGADASAFEVDNTGLYIKAGTVLDFEAKPSYAVTVNVDDPTVGLTPDALANFTLNVTNVVNEGAPTLFVSEVAPWSSGNSPLAADWFEVTNTGSSAVDITGWKMDDSSNSFASAVALNGVTSIGAGESAIFIETSTPATTAAAFANLWFGGSAPAGLQIGSYSGSGVGLSTSGDAVNLFDSTGVLQASVSFGASPASAPFATFDNAAGLDNATISQLSVAGVDGGAVAAGDANEIGSPGSIASGNQAPTAVALTNQVTSIVEDTSTASRIKVADVTINDDAFGTNNLSVSGADAAAFEVDNTGLYIKAGTALDFETKSSYAVTVNVDDPTVGATPDASSDFTLNVTDVINEGTPTLFVSEVAPWSSSDSPLGADWFEVTNTGSSAVDITGWKMDDNSNSSTVAVALNGVTSIGAGESVIFIETSTPATAAADFVNLWFGGHAPAGLQIGSYSGSGVGLSGSGDAVNLFDSHGVLQADVSFGASPSSAPFATFDNAAGLDNTAISQLSAVGLDGGAVAAGDANEIGSPGSIVNAHHPANDFDGDGHTDVLFSGPFDAGTGFAYQWQMNDRAITGQGGVDLFPSDFSVQVTGDFNGDGKADVLFENPTTGGVWELQLDGTTVVSEGAVDVGDGSYSLLGSADFNGDGMSDLLWRGPTGFVYEWQMNGLTDTGAGVDALDPSWHVVGAGDFNGDGNADILLRNIGATLDNGAFYLWEMNGNSIIGQGGIERPDTSWVTLGTGDFDGDGKTDIALRNVSATADNGAVWVYLMDGTTIKAQGAAGIADPATWHLQTIGDLNGDGKDDILFRNDAGTFYSWDMNGTGIASEGLAGTQAGNWADPSLHVITQHWDLV